MSVAVTIRINNLDQIMAKFKAAPAKMTQELNTAVSRVLDRVQSDALKLAPVNKQSGGGNLRQSIKGVMIGPARARITVGASYGVFVHEGTAPHTITVVNKKVLANKRTGQFFGRVVHHPGTKANPFLRLAVEMNDAFITKEFQDAVLRVIE